jgi:hypothetical protein
MDTDASDSRPYKIYFKGLSAADATKAASSLAMLLRDLDQPGVEVAVAKDTIRTQDLGTVIVLMLGTKAVVEVAKGIASWLRRRADAGGLVIMDVEGNYVEVRGPAAESVDVARIAQALGHKVGRSAGR